MIQRVHEDVALHRHIMRPTEWIAHREIQEDRSRRQNLKCQVTTGTDINGRDAGFLHNPRYQTHGLVIERSGRHQDEEVDLIFLQFAHECRGRLFDDRGAIVDASHESAPQALGHRADHARLGEFSQALEGK
jgi:hypothetical protein